MSMIFGEPKAESDLHSTDADADSPARPSPAIIPLAVPSIASPGAMLAIVMLIDNSHFALPVQALTAAVMASVIGVACIFMLLAGRIIRLTGNSGAAIISRVIGMILASVAADTVLSALLEISRSGALSPAPAKNVENARRVKRSCASALPSLETSKGNAQMTACSPKQP